MSWESKVQSPNPPTRPTCLTSLTSQTALPARRIRSHALTFPQTGQSFCPMLLSRPSRRPACAAAAARAFPPARNGAWFAQQPGEAKYVICNGDEGDPGAFMDRMILESFPYRVIEGLAIAAVAVGAHEAIFYIRHEYPAGGAAGESGPGRMRAARLAGQSVCWAAITRCAFSIKEGAGAFVCGEETALIASIEGRRGMPRLRPPFPAQVRPVGQADAHQQRRDARDGAVDHSPRRRGLRRASAPRPARAQRSSRWPARSAAPG